jgi:RNA polymerase sigma factor (sigma-70 family)
VRLTPRESSVLHLLASGQSTREISQALDLAPNTVRTYRQRLFHKLDVHTAVEAVVRGKAGSLPAADPRPVTLRDGLAYVEPGSGAVLLGGTAALRGLPTLPDMRNETPLSPRPAGAFRGEPSSAAGTQQGSRVALGDRDLGGTLRDAAKGDQEAWDRIVSSYVGLVWSVARSCGLSASDTSDVVQTTWLRLVENVDRIEDPNRLGAWLSTTARRECLRLIAKSRRTTPVATIDILTDERGPAAPAPDAGLLDRERDAQVQAAIARLPAHCQQLLQQLMLDPRPSYSTIAATLQMPIGSIGPTRGRCLRRLQLLLGESSVAHTDDGDVEQVGH